MRTKKEILARRAQIISAIDNFEKANPERSKLSHATKRDIAIMHAKRGVLNWVLRGKKDFLYNMKFIDPFEERWLTQQAEKWRDTQKKSEEP